MTTPGTYATQLKDSEVIRISHDPYDSGDAQVVYLTITELRKILSAFGPQK